MIVKSDWYIAISKSQGTYLTLNKDGFVGETHDFSRAVKVRNKGFIQSLITEANNLYYENTRVDDYAVFSICFEAI